MLYIIKDNKLFAKVSGDYNLEDYKELKAEFIENDNTELVYNSHKGKLELPSNTESIIIRRPFDRSNKLIDLIKNHNLWDRIINDGEKSLKLNIAVTLLINTIMYSRDFTNKDFIKSISKYIKALKSTSSAKQLSEQEVNTLQEFINKSEFELDLSKIV